MESDSRYIIGIDLGTTNCSVSYVDTDRNRNPALSVESFKLPQLVHEGVVEKRLTLPSFYYLSEEHEFSEGVLKLPWKGESAIVGFFAKEYGARNPSSLVQSAKSWLCNVAAERMDKILPFGSSSSQKVSPVEATVNYLSHIQRAWNHQIGKNDPSLEFEQQEIIVTVPASFDEVARELTVEAAKRAGYKRLTLLEEPTSALYGWIRKHENSLDQFFREGDSILVCDIGGGTSDFSLIDVVEKGGKLSFQRMAVGEHLLLGGDNIDLACAHFIQQKLEEQGTAVGEERWGALLYQARRAKEALLGEELESYQVIIQGRGASVVGGSVSIDLKREEVVALVADGFFPQSSWEESLAIKKKEGIRSIGLSYESEPAVTKHLAHFLSSALSGKETAPTHLLFNGGTMKPLLFQNRVLNALHGWFPDRSITPLFAPHLDLAVSRGAAYYGKVKRGLGVRIGGGSSRSFYLKVALAGGESKALTVFTRGAEEGMTFHPDYTFELEANAPVMFEVYSSHVRIDDKEGELVEIDQEQFHALPPICTVLKYGKKSGGHQKIPVVIEAVLSEVGTLELYLVSQLSNHRWKLQFQYRSSSGQEDSIVQSQAERSDEVYDLADLEEVLDKISDCYSKPSKLDPSKLMESLEHSIGKKRDQWSPYLLRTLFDRVMELKEIRLTSPTFEERWWHLVGYLLRPGFGYPLDDHKVKEVWRVVLSELNTRKPLEVQLKKWICLRRISGGLNKGQQTQIAAPILSELFDKKSGQIVLKRRGEFYPYEEKIRMLASFELLDHKTKKRVGDAVVKRIVSGEGVRADYWALGRIGARDLFYGSVGDIVSKECCLRWMEQIGKSRKVNKREMIFPVTAIASRTGEREIDLPEKEREKILQQFPVGEKGEALMEAGHQMDRQEADQFFGDKLPVGLTLVGVKQ